MKDIPAFPINDGLPYRPETDGMTLRDYFAAKAMQALLAHPESSAKAPASAFAIAAYKAADAMMKAREA